MDERQEKSILEMGRGAIMERADYEMRAMIRNIWIRTPRQKRPES